MTGASKTTTSYPRSQFTNVFWSKTQQKWNYRVKDPVTMKQKCGTHDDETEAARAADMEIVRLMHKYPELDMHNKINFPGLVDMTELEDLLLNDSDDEAPVPAPDPSTTPVPAPVQESVPKRKRAPVMENDVRWVVDRLYRSLGVRSPTQQDWEASFSSAAKNVRLVLEQTQARFPNHDLDMERDFIQDTDFGNWETGLVTHESVVALLERASIHVVRVHRHEVLTKSHETFVVYGTVQGKTSTQAVVVMDQRIHAPDIRNNRGKHITRPVEDLWNYFAVVTEAYYVLEARSD